MSQAVSQLSDTQNVPALPHGWVWTRVGEIGQVETGTTPPKARAEYYGKNYPFYKPTDLNAGYYTRRSEDGLSIKGITKARLLPEKSILVTCIGATIGKTGFIRQEGASNQQINAIIPERNILPEYIYFIGTSPQFQESIIGTASATTLPILSKGKFEMLPIPLPPLPEQHRIVAKIEELFTRLDAGVEALNKVKAQLKHYRQAVLRDAFQGKLTQEWREAHKGELEPASKLLERIKEERRKNAKGKYKELPPLDTSDLPDLPEGWVWTVIREVSLLVTKGSTPTSYGFHYTSSGINFIKVENLRGGRLDKSSLSEFITEDTHEFLKRSKLSENDVLFSIAGTIGRVAVVQHEDLPANTNQAIALILCPWQFISPSYLKNVLESSIARSSIEKRPRGIGMNNVSLDDVNNIVVPFPPLPEQHKIVEEIERRLSVADEIEKAIDQSLKQAGRLRQSILKTAFEGKLVPQDPADEPAEKLLQRIKEERVRQQTEAKNTKGGKGKALDQARLLP